jgi:hypothetical protein
MRIEVHHDYSHSPVVIDAYDGMVNMKVDDGTDDGAASVALTTREARAIAGVLLVMAQEAER